MAKGLTPRLYFAESWNNFDFTLVAVGWVTQMVGGGGSDLLLLRILRLIRSVCPSPHRPKCSVISNIKFIHFQVTSTSLTPYYVVVGAHVRHCRLDARYPTFRTPSQNVSAREGLSQASHLSGIADRRSCSGSYHRLFAHRLPTHRLPTHPHTPHNPTPHTPPTMQASRPCSQSSYSSCSWTTYALSWA